MHTISCAIIRHRRQWVCFESQLIDFSLYRFLNFHVKTNRDTIIRRSLQLMVYS